MTKVWKELKGTGCVTSRSRTLISFPTSDCFMQLPKASSASEKTRSQSVSMLSAWLNRKAREEACYVDYVEYDEGEHTWQTPRKDDDPDGNPTYVSMHLRPVKLLRLT